MKEPVVLMQLPPSLKQGNFKLYSHPLKPEQAKSGIAVVVTISEQKNYTLHLRMDNLKDGLHQLGVEVLTQTGSV